MTTFDDGLKDSVVAGGEDNAVNIMLLMLMTIMYVAAVVVVVVHAIFV